jgi:hypothetical protein
MPSIQYESGLWSGPYQPFLCIMSLSDWGGVHRWLISRVSNWWCWMCVCEEDFGPILIFNMWKAMLDWSGWLFLNAVRCSTKRMFSVLVICPMYFWLLSQCSTTDLINSRFFVFGCLVFNWRKLRFQFSIWFRN